MLRPVYDPLQPLRQMAQGGRMGPALRCGIKLADRAYDSDALRLEMAARGAWANIKPMPGRKRRPPFSAFLYRYRNLVERFFSKLKHFRAVATRFEKHSENYLAVKLASSKSWMRFTGR
ncbi:transposase [Rhizobium tibeticum]|nr:transposase [Rhizobium tibeticum]